MVSINANPINKKNETPLSLCIKHGSLECLYFLLETGISIREEDVRLAREVSKPSIWQYIHSIYKEQASSSPKSNHYSNVSQQLTADNDSFRLQEKINELQQENAKLLEKIEKLSKETSKIEEIESIEMKDCIGRGEFGEVYRAEWRFTDVAVKKFYNDKDYNDELEILKNIRHPNIILLMAICKNPPLLITEYMELGSLSTVLHSNMSITHKNLIKMAIDVASGLLFLHTASHSIVHRDLKSANCLVNSFFQVKICDFGLARIKNTTLKDTKACGTIPYMSPEVLLEQKYSVKSDVYAFGILLWEIITRTKPFNDLAPVQIMYQVVHFVIKT